MSRRGGVDDNGSVVIRWLISSVGDPPGRRGYAGRGFDANAICRSTM